MQNTQASQQPNGYAVEASPLDMLLERPINNAATDTASRVESLLEKAQAEISTLKGQVRREIKLKQQLEAEVDKLRREKEELENLLDPMVQVDHCGRPVGHRAHCRGCDIHSIRRSQLEDEYR